MSNQKIPRELSVQVIHALGGPSAVARMVGMSPTGVQYWERTGMPWTRARDIAEKSLDIGAQLPTDFTDLFRRLPNVNILQKLDDLIVAVKENTAELRRYAAVLDRYADKVQVQSSAGAQHGDR